MIKGIAHSAFVVTDMEASIDFYCNKLGMSEAFELKDKDGNPWIKYIKIAPNQFIELFYGGGEPKEGQSYSHICLEVDDINEIAALMEEKNIPLTSKVNRGKDLNYQCWVADPDGNRIEFMMISPDSMQAKS